MSDHFMSQKMNVMGLSDDFPILQKIRSENSAFIPHSFYKSLEKFCQRNAIPVEVSEFGKTKTVKEICLQCLKAFILDEAVTKHHMSIDIISIAIRINAEVGHSKYYIDNGDLKAL